MTNRQIAVLVGSLSQQSLTRRVARTLMLLAPITLDLEIVEIGQLPLYNPDVDQDDGHPPPTYTEFRARMLRTDGVLFCTPEYNRSVPAALKNAIDVGSRPHGQSVWDGMPGGIVSVSTGATAGFGANHHLRQSLVCLNVPVMQQPEAYLGNVAPLFDGNTLIDAPTKVFLHHFIDAYGAWVERNGN